MRLELKHGVHCHWRRVEAVAIKVDGQKYKTPRLRFPLYIFRFIVYLQFSHVHDGTNAVAALHRLKGFVHLTERLAVSDELVHLERAAEIVGDEALHLGAALDASKGAALPHAAGDELER